MGNPTVVADAPRLDVSQNVSFCLIYLCALRAGCACRAADVRVACGVSLGGRVGEWGAMAIGAVVSGLKTSVIDDYVTFGFRV